MKEAPSLSEKLLGQISQNDRQLFLSEKAPVLSFLPPFLLQEVRVGEKDTQYSFESFEGREALLKAFPGVKITKGHPKEIYRFLTANEDAFLDFDQLGVIRLSRNPAQTTPMDAKMSRWLDYALSPELWGPEGKWTRFHEQLHKLFEKHNLLERTSVPGYYPLKSNAFPWEKYPLVGDLSGSTFTLVLSWTFSLSELRKLESIFHEEK